MGWHHFAQQVIDYLKRYDHEHGTRYAQRFQTDEAVKALAEAMMNVDRANYWQPIEGKVQA